ncbi:hypothetical protein PG985_002662 [Apiospora marii]|uniref:uncharacterized protein n=1 Tax=Apiospora marii TaxID=335849 RepID=UPI00312F49AD
MSSAVANITPLTIGAEAEGILPVVDEHAVGSASTNIEQIQPLLIRPGIRSGPREEGEDVDSDDPEYQAALQDWLFQEIRRSLANHVGVYLNELGDSTKVNVQSIHTAGGDALYYGWRVVEEATANIPVDKRREMCHDGVDYLGFELLTPAMQFNDQSLEEVAAVYRHLSEAPGFRPGPLIPETCGYHVHVGVGSERFSPHQARRLGCIVYATGRLLTQLLPSSRKGNLHSRMNRYYSFLAHGEDADFACMQVQILAQSQDPKEEDPGFGANGGAEESPLPESAETYLSSGPLEFSWEEGWCTPAVHSSTEVSRFAAFQAPSRPDSIETPSPASIADAVGVLMRCPSAAAVAQLMRPGRLGVSFNNYTSPAVVFMPQKPTIEFRQLSATFNADAACAWIRVTAQLCRVAIDWPWEDLNKLLRRCALGETEPDKYDVLDLLVDIGCADQAASIQDMIIDPPAGSPFARLNEPDDGGKQPGIGGNDASTGRFEIQLP